MTLKHLCYEQQTTNRVIMEPAKRVVVNTLAQHIRSVLNICLSLYSTRLVLKALGESDFGIYSLVAGVIALLGFLTNAMVITTQRQLSFYYGKGNLEDVRLMLSNSIFLHILLGLFLTIILTLIQPLLFNGVLIIETSRTDTAIVVYYWIVLSLLISFLAAPYRALFIARENIVFISIVDVLDGIIKLLAAIWLLQCPYDRLIAYAVIIALIMFFNLVALASWANIHFKECLLFPKRNHINRKSLKELTSFAGWTIYSIGCIIGRSQGMAILLNRSFGTIANASYGIAQQVFGSIQFLAQAVINAMSPQIVKAESIGERQNMLVLSELLSKYTVLLLSIVVIPLVFEMPAILKIWLGEVPKDAVILCQFTLIAALCDQTTIGLGTANQAIGKIKNYSIVINSIKLLTLPAVWIVLKLGHSIQMVMWLYVIFECICALGRLPFLKYTAGLSIHNFMKHVFARIALPIVFTTLACGVIVAFVQIPFRFLLTGSTAVITSAIFIWFFALESYERETAIQILKR